MADNDIIDFYKKADTDNKPEEPLKEQVETPEPVVSEAVAVPVPESNDPFDKFLFNLAEKLKTEKKITEQQQQQFNERIVQPTTNPEDPFAKFLESFAGLVKEDENINKEENIKEATIDFINKLKNDDFFDRDIPKVVPKVKQVKSKSKKYLPPKFAKKVEKVEEELPVIEQSTEPESQQEDKQPEPSNPYLKELQTADKKKNKIEDKISGLSDIKKIIAQQVQEQLSKYPNIGFTGGGGGTNAVQYAEGGTMNGDLNVTGKYLSGGVDISTLFGSGGGAVSGIPDRLIAGSETLRLYSDGTIDFPNDTIRPPDETILTLESENPLLSSYVRVALSPYAFFAYDNEGNSITFDQVDNAIVLTSQNEHEWTFNKQGVLAGPHNYLTVNALSSLGRILSGGKDLLEIFALSGTGGGGGGPTDRLINGSYQVVLSSNGNLTLPGAIVTASNSKLDFVGFGPNTAYLTTTPDDTTALFMGADVAELRAKTYASIATNTGVTTHLWKFGADSSLEFPQSSYIGPLYTANDSWFVTSPVEPGGIASADGQQYIQVNNGSDVLIGTGWPLSAHEWAFDINGNLRFPDNTTQTTAFTGNPDSSNYILDGGNTKGAEITIGTNDAYSLNFETSGITRMIITDAGNTGFGGTPYARVQYVLENDTDPPQITAWDNRHVQWGTGGAQAPGLGMSYSQSNGTINMAFLEPYVAWRNARMNFGTMTWYSGGTTLGLTQDSGGNVGIGTTTPSTKLEVIGTIKARKTETSYQDSVLKVISTESAAGTNWRGRALIGAEDLTFLMGTYNGIAGLGAHSWSSANTEDGAAWADLTINPDGAANTYIGGSGWNNSTAIVTVQNSTTNVGIGTTTPSTKLDVNGTITATGGNSDLWNEAYNTVTVITGSYLPLAGGTITGPTIINNNLTVTGNITALGTATFNNTVFTVSSALSVVNVGPGPALYVSQSPGNFDIASFYDEDGIEVLHVGNAPTPGTLAKVGVNESFPNKELTVRGSISATEVIYASGSNSNNWNTAYTSIQSNSASWFEPIRKFDYTTVLNVDYSYSGTAPYGTADNTPIWKLIRLTYANNGSISNSASAINSWTGRLTATYV